ncbi:MerR family transcriptional regulator [Vampirovibrio chlorellavorus]|uniref:MerR family transcriptional regulator n=1 Tax=Vampirovibrio chlorellavorus TaxID=758823 RepID=UPI0026EF09E0|nr:MerR family transcriptional regulator [Vampirovibrio chlorellavorus]
MYTVDTALESLRKYDIQEGDLLTWERELSLEIPVDEYGRKQYSPHHVNLFKNIKKHIALGRTIEEIRQLISLPPLENSRPRAVRPTAAGQTGSQATLPAGASPPESAATSSNPVTSAAKVIQKSPYAAVPKRPNVGGASAAGGAANVVNLVHKLNKEKDQLYKKLLETEKLNSHLYSANSLFHKKVRDLTLQIQKQRENFNENEKFKLLDDKARLQKQLIDAEKLSQYKQEEILRQKMRNDDLQLQIRQRDEKIQAMQTAFDADKFCGDWMESGTLAEVVYDNFGINIEPERVRLFRISERPSRIYGPMAVINTSYQYETNNLWKREETLMVSYMDEQTLEGELVAEYILDGVPVAKALYRVTCRRSQ